MITETVSFNRSQFKLKSIKYDLVNKKLFFGPSFYGWIDSMKKEDRRKRVQFSYNTMDLLEIKSITVNR